MRMKKFCLPLFLSNDDCKIWCKVECNCCIFIFSKVIMKLFWVIIIWVVFFYITMILWGVVWGIINSIVNRVVWSVSKWYTTWIVWGVIWSVISSLASWKLLMLVVYKLELVKNIWTEWLFLRVWLSVFISAREFSKPVVNVDSFLNSNNIDMWNASKSKFQTRTNSSWYKKYKDPQTGKSEYTHRRVAEKKMWWEIYPWYEVHHINGDKTDNRPQNLTVLSKEKHKEIHRKNNLTSDQ